MSARALMILGTASHVGKSILTAALGRILADEGYRVAPFKAQNMSLNSAATPDGREIGRAQALQAEACRIPARAEMNPILIKPSSDCASQVVVMGRVWGQVTAADYHQRRVEELFPVVLEAYQTLAREFDVILLEGAGSPAEINLKAHDIVNMRMARAAGARCLLAGDIDRGGVFASLLGTVELLDAGERELLHGFLINKFRGDIRLLEPGIEMIARRIQLPCAGVVPYLPNLGLDEEDSVALFDRPRARQAWSGGGEGPHRPLRVGVLAFPFLANFTDFDALAAEPSVSLAYVEQPEELRQADLVILPGSKQTLNDLAWLRHRGFEPALRAFGERSGIIGICGGMQMLGESIEDPDGAEPLAGRHAASGGPACFMGGATRSTCVTGEPLAGRQAASGGPACFIGGATRSTCVTGENGGVPRREPGLSLLPIATVLRAEKVTRTARGRARLPALFGQCFQGYEIHQGETVYRNGAEPFAEIQRGGTDIVLADGAVSGNGRVFGTYVHGLFAGDPFRHAFLNAARASCELAPPQQLAFVAAERERRMDRLAAHVRGAVDMDLIRQCVGERP